MSHPSCSSHCEAPRSKRDRWLAFLMITLGLNSAALILFPDFLTDALTVPLALICGVPAAWGFYTLLFFRTRRERVVGYFGVVPLVIWAACLVSLVSQSAADLSGLPRKQVNAIAWHLNHLAKVESERDFKAAELDRDALVKLGCFEERNFQLRFRLMTSNNVPELVQMVTNSSFINYNYALRINLTNAGILGVTAHRRDIPAWENLISAFDSAETR
jgi:hypothetical protein